jgi:hypothetical protein
MIPRKTETTSQYSLAIAVTAVATRFATKPSSTRQIHQFANSVAVDFIQKAASLIVHYSHIPPVSMPI